MSEIENAIYASAFTWALAEKGYDAPKANEVAAKCVAAYRSLHGFEVLEAIVAATRKGAEVGH